MVPGDAVHLGVCGDGAGESHHAALPHVGLRTAALHLADGHRQDCEREREHRHIASVSGFHVAGLCKFNMLEVKED